MKTCRHITVDWLKVSKDETHTVLEVLESIDGRELAHGFTKQPPQDLAFHVHGEPLVEPEVLKVAVCD